LKPLKDICFPAAPILPAFQQRVLLLEHASQLGVHMEQNVFPGMEQNTQDCCGIRASELLAETTTVYLLCVYMPCPCSQP
jgi:hypothetical protein